VKIQTQDLMSESIFTKMKQKQHIMKTNNQKKKNLNFSIFDILMENGNNKFMDIHNKLILAFQLA
jgi:hypothetical protein